MTDIHDILSDFTWDNYKDITEELTRVNLVDLDGEMARQATIYSYYYGLMSAAKSDANKLESDLHRLMGVLRSGFKASSSTKLTAKDLDDLVLSSPEYDKASSEVRELNFKYEILKGLTRALEHKKDMLVQLSSNRRAETKLYN
jgi:hypothetical protein